LEDRDAWVGLFRETDAGIAAHRAGETTGVVVALGPRGIVGVSTGNSEAWLVGLEWVDNLTVGQRTEGRLGARRTTPTPFQRAAPKPAVLVVASDGLFKFAAPDVIASVVRTQAIGPAAENLVELVKLRSGKVAEDVAVVLVRLDEVPPPS